jgi:pre-mRNA-splicing factor CWC22
MSTNVEESNSSKRKMEEDQSNTQKKRKIEPEDRLSEREKERERQRLEREERQKNGLATSTPKLKSQETMDINSTLKPGGVYIPPFKLKRSQTPIKDKKSIEYQRINWDALKKTINGIVNKVNVANITNIIPELFSENLVRGRGLFCRAVIKAQQASPNFTHVYAALISVINTKMPEIGELILQRVVIGFRKSYKRNDKMKCLSFATFIAHLVNQQVVHEILAGQIIGLLLEKPTDDSVELAVNFTKECGFILNSVSPKILNAVFERFRGILHEGEIDKRVQYMIEGLFSERKKNFDNFPGIIKELDLVEQSDQITHEIELDDKLQKEDQLDYFHYDKDFEENEEQYKLIKEEILGNEEENAQQEDTEQQEEEKVSKSKKIEIETHDKNLLDIVQLKRQIYLTIMSSVNFEETVHKLVKAGLTEGREIEVCSMIIECCSQERSYSRYYGLVGQRFCQLDPVFQQKFDQCFKEQYAMIHRLETNKLRNVAKFFAHLLSSDGLSWTVMEYIHLNQDETTSSSRIFVKILFQELCETLGLKKLHIRLQDVYLRDHFNGIFPTDNQKNMRFAINFFTSIGLGGLTEELREKLKNAPKAVKPESSSSDSSDSDSDSDSSDSSDSEDSERESRRK